jgi:hypothetical protein
MFSTKRASFPSFLNLYGRKTQSGANAVETSAKSVREQTRRAVLNQRPGLASEQRQPELVAAASTWQLLAIYRVSYLRLHCP